ncbi:unnamed protein product, partial [Rotaria magnacalcarata]
MNFSNDTYQTQSNQNSTADDEGNETAFFNLQS